LIPTFNFKFFITPTVTDLITAQASLAQFLSQRKNMKCRSFIKDQSFRLILSSLLIFAGPGYSQDTLTVSKDSVIQNNTTSQFNSSALLRNDTTLPATPAFIFPYNVSFKKDGPVIASAIGVGAIGYLLISNKHGLTLEQVNNKNPDNLPFFDRWSAGYYSKSADRTSYAILYASYLYPVLSMYLSKNIHNKIKEVSVLFIETMSVATSMFTLSDGLIYRSRPYVYGNAAPLDLRMKKRAQRSFYSGHVTTVAAASFFMAQVHKDLGGNPKLQPWLWAVAIALPAVMSYERIKAGYHFLSDCVVSYGMGAATGLLIPALHRNKKLQNISLMPQIGNGYRGISFTLHIK
jgi:PAP2 superfamily